MSDSRLRTMFADTIDPAASSVYETVPRAFDSAAHGRVGLHVMHLDLS